MAISSNKTLTCGNISPMLQTSTLPLSEGDILHDPELVPNVHELSSTQRLRKNIYNLLIRGNVPQLHRTPLHHLSNIVVLHLHVLRPVMLNWIYLHTTLVVTMNHGRLQPLTKQSCKEFLEPNCLTCCHTCYNIFDLCYIQGNCRLFPTEPGNHGRPQTEATS